MPINEMIDKPLPAHYEEVLREVRDALYLAKNYVPDTSEMVMPAITEALSKLDSLLGKDKA